jgi:hypothetical protein
MRETFKAGFLKTLWILLDYLPANRISWVTF